MFGVGYELIKLSDVPWSKIATPVVGKILELCQFLITELTIQPKMLHIPTVNMKPAGFTDSDSALVDNIVENIPNFWIWASFWKQSHHVWRCNIITEISNQSRCTRAAGANTLLTKSGKRIKTSGSEMWSLHTRILKASKSHPVQSPSLYYVHDKDFGGPKIPEIIYIDTEFTGSLITV